MNPLVSITMAAYNSEAFIGEAIGSALRQTEQSWELIVVDDGSTDATARIAVGFKDPRVRLIQQENAGPAAARNTALSQSRGKYLAFLDADDLLLPGHLACATAHLEQRPELEAVHTDGYFTDRSGKPWKPLSSARRGPFEGDMFEQIIRASDAIGPLGTVVMRADAVFNRGLAFDPGITIGEDWDFLARFGEQNRIGWLDVRMYLYRLHFANISRSVDHARRRDSLARCRMKAINLRRFGECSLATREHVFYDLLIDLLGQRPQDQNAVLGEPEFQRLPAACRAKLFRLMAVRRLLACGNDEFVIDWLRESAELNPWDVRGGAISLMYRLSPGLCRCAVRARRLGRNDDMLSAAFELLAEQAQTRPNEIARN